MGSSGADLTEAIFDAALWASTAMAPLVVAALTFSRLRQARYFWAAAALIAGTAAGAVGSAIPFFALQLPAVQAADGNWALLLAIPIGLVWGFVTGSIAALAVTPLLVRIGTPLLRMVVAVSVSVFLGSFVVVLLNVIFHRPA